MSYGDWDEIIREYEDIFVNSRYSENAKGMIELIPRLRRDLSLAEVIPGTSLSTLFLAVPNAKARVYVWCEQLNLSYDVYILCPDSRRTDSRIVNGDDVIAYIKLCLEKVCDLDA